MAINIGTASVSEQQLSLLQRARRMRSILELVPLLDYVVSDGDIVEGRESLHPAWLTIFKQRGPELENDELPIAPHVVQRLRNTFDSLQPIDALARTIDPTTENVVFLLGADASKPSPSNIPTVAELLPEMLNRARRLDREQVNNLVDFCSRREIYNIEDLLTATQISAFCSRNPRILSLVEFQLFGEDENDRPHRPMRPRPIRANVSSVAYMQDTLQVLFGLLSNLMLPAKPNTGHQAIVEYLTSRPSTPIVTTNYDCCMDLALINNNVPFSYEMDFANPEVLTASSDPVSPLIKLHGSLNWFYCETCQDVRLIDISQTVGDYTNQRGEYPIISVCNACGGQRRGLLVPPHAMKFDVAPPLQPLIANAASYFEKATLIVVVGFSFADADLYISRMIIKAMQASADTKMMIIDPDSTVTDRVRRKFEAQIPYFEGESRIVSLQDDCSEILPQFLGKQLLNGLDDNTSEQPSEDLEATTPAVPE